MTAERGPLVLGAGGRIGTMWRRLAARGLWPGAEPVWHTRDGREGTLGWDLSYDPPSGLDLAGVPGIIVLAGRTPADGVDPQFLIPDNEGPVLMARRLARDQGVGPVLLCSSAAIYGTGTGPHREDGPVTPTGPYGRAKCTMEDEARVDLAFRGGPAHCALRIGNVAGADALFGAMAAGPVTLDRLPDGTSPRRACVGPLTLARAMVALLARPDLPAVLNLAQPGLVAMEAILRAAGVAWDWREAPPSALASLEMDLARLEAIAPLPPATPESLVAEARLAGWRPWGEAP